MSFGSEYEDIEDDFLEESNQIINKIFGESLTEDQKEEIISSLISLFRKYSTDYCDYIENQDNITLPSRNYSYLQNSTPVINLVLTNSPSNAFYSPFSGYTQPQMIQPPPQAPFYFNYQQPQIPTTQSLPLQQPNFIYFNQPIIENSHTSKKKSKKEKKSHDQKSDKKSHQKHKESEKKSKKRKESDKKKQEIQTFDKKPGDQFDGIIKYLTSKTGGNIHKNGTIELTSNSIVSSFNDQNPENILDFGNDSWFGAKAGSKDFWICFDFKDRRIEISSYTIKSYSFDSGNLKSWVLEISDDSQNWKQIDQHSSDSSLNGPNRVASFNVNRNQFSRYVRIRHTGEFWEFRPFISPGFSQIEFYGRLKSPK